MKTKPLPTPKSSPKLIPKVTRVFVSGHNPVDSKIVSENWVVADPEIRIDKAFKGDAWIRKCLQHLLTQIRSTKTESLPSQKSSMKHLPQVTSGFVRAHSPFWFWNSQQKLSQCRLRSHQRNRFHRWSKYSLAHPPRWLRQSQWKLIYCRLRNRQPNRFHRWHVDSSALAAPVDIETVNEN